MKTGRCEHGIPQVRYCPECDGFIDRQAGAYECPKCHRVMKEWACENHECKESKVMTTISWNDIDEDYKRIETPFDIESILRSDSKLLEQWKRKPFYLDIDSNGDLVIKYIDKVLI